jgi:hypothetical protein
LTPVPRTRNFTLVKNQDNLPLYRRFLSTFPRRSVFSLIFLGVFVVLNLGSEQSLVANSGRTSSNATADMHSGCKIIYAGFVGALETSNHKHSGVVQIRDTLRGSDFSDVCANSFIPISWSSGRDWILTHFPNHPGPLTTQELELSPRVIMVGHSTGGWAMLSVARELREKHIPVELTVQIDSVGITDYTIPANVKTGAIFYAWDALFFMNTKHIRLEDPDHTKLIAKVTVKDASHLSITRDPRIRELVMDAIINLRNDQPVSGKPVIVEQFPVSH